MPATYFLGAGASAADGLPLMRELNWGVAAYILDQAPDELSQFYAEIYAVTHEALTHDRALWKRFINHRGSAHAMDVRSALPDLIETLSLIDVCVADEQSLGPSRRQGSSINLFDLNPTRLRRVRRQLTMAIASAVQSATIGLHSSLSNEFIARLSPEDVIISTNWDMLIDRAIVDTGKRSSPSPVTRAPIRYHCVGERPVDLEGEDIEPAGRDARTLLKLHGGLNWFGCICCGNVYVNLEGGFVIDPEKPRLAYDICDCGAQLQNVMVAPSFVKDYRSVSLRSVWHEAQKRLENSEHWVFIGYSLPSDDYHIRAMLMRAMRTRLNAERRGGNSLKVTAVIGSGDTTANRYRDMFRLTGCQCETTGFEAFVQTMGNQARS